MRSTIQKKTRLDVAVFEGGYAPSREKAKAIIMAGQVYVNNQKVDKAGFELKEGDQLEVRGKTLKYASRGGLKLEKAMQVFPHHFNRQNLYGCGSVYRWVYGLYAAKRRKAGVFR